MHSFKHVLILLPLICLVATAPTNFPRELGATAIVDTVGGYNLPSSGDGVIQRRAAPPDENRGTLGKSVDFATETTGKGVGLGWGMLTDLWHNTPRFWNKWMASFRSGKSQKRDLSSASVDDASTLSKRRVQQVYDDGLDYPDPDYLGADGPVNDQGSSKPLGIPGANNMPPSPLGGNGLPSSTGLTKTSTNNMLPPVPATNALPNSNPATTNRQSMPWYKDPLSTYSKFQSMKATNRVVKQNLDLQDIKNEGEKLKNKEMAQRIKDNKASSKVVDKMFGLPSRTQTYR